MDCEKFDLLVMDALYDELDELTLAAARRHTESCTRCQAAWSGLKATRKLGVLAFVEPPTGLSERIMRLAEEAQRNVPWPRRVGRAISWAGSYAMRPQMAMAALLLLMVGSSLLLLRAKPNRSGPAQVSVTERGVPEHGGSEPDTGSDRSTLAANPAAAALHGPVPPNAAQASPPVPSDLDETPPAPAATDPIAALASRARSAKEGEVKGGRAEAEPLAFAAPPPAKKSAVGASDMAGTNGAGALADSREVASLEEKRAGAAFAMPAAPGSPVPAARAAAPPAAAGAGGAAAPDPFTQAMALYRAGRYAEAVPAFDRAAGAGDANAALASLYAARSAQASGGCSSAVGRYEATAARFSDTGVAADALWAAAGCRRALGQFGQARADYLAVRKFPAYRDRADQAIAALGAAPSAETKSDTQRPAAAPPAAPPP